MISPVCASDALRSRTDTPISPHVEYCCAPVCGLSVFTVPGDGIVDFKAIFAGLDKLDYKGWLVVEAEQDPAKANPLEYAKKARAYIKEISGL